MKSKQFAFTGLLLVLVLLLAACQPAATTVAPTQAQAATATKAPTATTAPAATATESIPETGSEEPTLMVADNADLGPILVDGNGMTLYMFTKDEPNKVNCAGDCLAKWPPLLTKGSPIAGEGVDDSLIGTATMADGSMIVTYNEMPLYYWINDKAAGDATGQNVGEVWFVVNPDGKPVGMASSSTDDSAASGTVVNMVDDPKLGPILVDEKGMTLYMFTKDEPNKVNCVGDCLVKWPPLLTEGDPVAGEGVDDSLLGTAPMEDGSTIVTYNKMPLYYWVSDKAAGDTTGQNVGSVWFVVNPDGDPVGAPDSSSSSSNTASSGTVVNMVDDATLGPILVDAKGMTLYMFTKDGPNTVNCAGDCLVAWPPLLTTGDPVAGKGVDQSLLGTAKMADGKMIVTYNKMPLYYWQADTKAGMTTGQDVGGVWYVVNPDGDPVGMNK